jgi:hypothetical protein
MTITKNGQSAAKPLLNEEGSTTIPLGSTEKLQNFFGKGWLINYSGVYQIVNKFNNKVYIGGTLNLRERIINHVSELKHHKHHSIHLQRAFDKYGIDAFYFEILEICDSNWKIIGEIEQKYINSHIKTFHKTTYNIKPFSQKGFYGKHTEETIQKIIFSRLNTKKICWFKDKKLVETFNCISKAVNFTKFSKTCIYEACKTKRYVTKKGDCFCFEEDILDLQSKINYLKFVPWNKK